MNKSFSQQIVYVDSSATGLNNGGSWANAFTSLDSAFNKNSQLGYDDMIRVAKGTYRPSQVPRGSANTADDKDFSFHFPDFCAILGGYPSGGGTRNSKLNLTVLSGDIGIAGLYDDNVYHVTIFQGSEATVDGFTITDGFSAGTGSLSVNGVEISRESGAGIMIDNSFPDILNMVIRNNVADYGGGIMNKLSYLTITNSFFSGNISAYTGGAILNDSASNMEILNCVFFENLSESGGAVYNNKSSSRIIHSTFANNEGRAAGGAIMNFQVRYCFIKNTVFSLNNFLSGFEADFPNADIAEELSDPVANSHTDVVLSSLQSFIGGFGCVYAADAELVDPADPDGPDNMLGTTDDGLVISPQSPGFNTGSNSEYDFDITGASRNSNSNFDMGAYEIDPCSRLTSRTIYIDSTQSGNHSGNSWNDALSSLQAAINLVVAGCADTIKVAKGTYYPSTVPRNWQAPQDNILPGGFKTFHLPGNTVLMGGYAQGGIARDPVLFPTVLSHRNNTTSTSNQVVTAINISNVTLDGFTITNGNAAGDSVVIDNKSYRKDAGGGMIISGSNILIRNSKFLKNQALSLGAGIYAESSVLKMDNIEFENNNAYYTYEASGGGMYITGCGVGSIIKNSSFKNNRALYYGGGLALIGCYNGFTIDSCNFKQNRTLMTGGNVVGGGAIFSTTGSRSYISHSLFEENTAYLGGALNLGGNSHTFINQSFFIRDSAHLDGGAIFNRSALETEMESSVFYANSSARAGGAIEVRSPTKIHTSSFYENKATAAGAAINKPVAVSLEVVASVFRRNALGGSYTSPGSDITADAAANWFIYNSLQSLVTGYWDHNISGVNPLFKDSSNLIGPDSIWGTSDDGLQLAVQSPLINEAPSSSIFNYLITDIKGDARIQNNNADIGAYEADFCAMAAYSDRTAYVDSSIQSGNHTGNSWQNAFASLEDALKAARAHCIDTIKVAKGSYAPLAAPGYNPYNVGPIDQLVFSIPDSVTIQGGYPSGGGIRSITGNLTNLVGVSPVLVLFDNVKKSHLDGFNLKNSGITATASEFVVRNLVVRNMYANGPSILLSASNGQFINCLFENNRSPSYAGVIRQDNSLTKYTNCVFANNYLSNIGAGCVFVTGADTASFFNCTFFKNRCQWGGAIRKSSASKVNVYNSVFWKNKSQTSFPDPFSNEIWDPENTPPVLTISHSLFEYQPITFAPDNSNIYGIYPAFADTALLAGADGIWGTTDDGLSLTLQSIVLNKGLNSLIPAGITTDITGINRIANDTVEMGAYEFDCTCFGRYTNTLVAFGTQETSVDTIGGCGSLRYYVSPVASTRYIALIGDKGNTINPTLVTVDATNNLVHFRTNGSDTTALANRMISVVAPGLFPANGGVKLRIYYDSTEFNSLPSRFRHWFKHPSHTKAEVLADLEINGLTNSISIYPASTGTENGIAYVEFENITSFSTFGLIASNTNMALPVGFIYFTARQVGNLKKVELNWATSWEINNDRFEIERSIDGVQWKMIGGMNGNGTLSQESRYSFIDNSPDFPQSFYRIKQVDIDGKYSYSVVRLVEFSDALDNDFVISPNPAFNEIFIRFKTNQKTVNYELIDMSGRKIITGAYSNVKDIYLDINKVGSGVYLLKVNERSKKLVIK